MLRVTVLCIGGLKERFWREACAEYGKRLGAFCRLEIRELEEERVPERPSAAQLEAACAAEGRRLLSQVPSGAAIVAMCIEGGIMTSPELAAWMEKQPVNGTGHLAFLIGGSWGLSEEAKAAARLRLSMSPMTFPHQLARVMLLEQLYRAFQIASGGKYHK